MQIKNIDMPFKGYIKSQKLISYVLREEYLSKHFKISKKTDVSFGIMKKTRKKWF